MTLSISILHHYVECRIVLLLCWVSLCRVSHFLIILLCVIVLSVIMLNVVMLNVITLSMVEPQMDFTRRIKLVCLLMAFTSQARASKVRSEINILLVVLS